MQTINVSEAKGRLSEMISRASVGERFMIRKYNRTMAVLVGLSDFKRLERMMQAAFYTARTLG